MAMRLIVFDLDGTLVKIPIDFAHVRKSLQVFFNTDDDFVPLLQTVKRFSGNKSMLDKALDIIRAEEISAADGTVVIGEAPNILRLMSSRGFLLALATMQGRNAVDLILAKMNVANLFSCIQTRDDSLDKGSQISAILQKLGVDPSQSIVVGDRIDDVDSARKNGCPAVIVGKDKSVHQPDCVSISTLSELPALDFFH